MEEVILPSLPEYPSCTDSEIDEDIQYPSDSLFDAKDTEILEMVSKHRRNKRRSGSVMGFEATYDLVHRVAYASNVCEIMLDCFAMNASTENLEVTWEAIKLNPKNDLIWESRFHILVGLDKLHEELTFLTSNADNDAILDSELFWNHILSIIEMLGTEAARQQLQFAMSILSAQPHMVTPWTFMLKNLHFIQCENDHNYMHNVLLQMNQTVAGILCQNDLAWSFRKSLVVNLPVASRHEELKFVRGILENDPTNSLAWLYLLWFVQTYVKDFGIDIIDAELIGVTDVVKCRDNMHAWCYRQWLVAEKNQNGRKIQSDGSIICEERKLTGQVLADNVKNIYAWSHRKWTMERFGGWRDELMFCQQLLEMDIRNTLAWNQKTIIIMRWGWEASQELRELELGFTETAIYKDRENEHPWMYLTCLYQDKPFVHQSIGLIYESFTWATMRDPIDVLMNRRWCVNALATLLHLISLGYKPNKKVCGAVFRLCSNIKLAADITDEAPCLCAVTDNKCETCRSCLISILQHIDVDARRPWKVVY